MTNVQIIDDDVTRLHDVSRVVETKGLSVASTNATAPLPAQPEKGPDAVDSPAGDTGVAQHETSGGALTFMPGTPLAEVERQVILATLASYGGARNKTAAALGISQKTLYNKLKQFEAKAEISARVSPIVSQ